MALVGGKIQIRTIYHLQLNFLILHIRFYKLASYLQPKTALKEESPYICGR